MRLPSNLSEQLTCKQQRDTVARRFSFVSMAAAVIPDSNGNLHEINTEVRGSLFTAERRNFRETRRPNDAHTGYGKIARPALVIAHTVARVYRSISTVSGRSWGGGRGGGSSRLLIALSAYSSTGPRYTERRTHAHIDSSEEVTLDRVSRQLVETGSLSSV